MAPKRGKPKPHTSKGTDQVKRRRLSKKSQDSTARAKSAVPVGDSAEAKPAEAEEIAEEIEEEAQVVEETAGETEEAAEEEKALNSNQGAVEEADMRKYFLFTYNLRFLPASSQIWWCSKLEIIHSSWGSQVI